MADCKHRVMDNCKKDNRPCIYAKECFDPKPMTNGDRIRAMSDEGLAEWLMIGVSSDPCDYCKHNVEPCDGSPCKDKTDVGVIIEWLKQPAEVDV